MILFEDIDTVETNLERLIILRLRLNLKKYEMARAIGYNESYYSQVENGVYPISDTLIKKVNNYLIKEQKKHGEYIFSQYE
ncbi:helix-turn-helix domain-containing protein [Oceanobacillus luteolus]|uniref:Helix-turn-helix domain-containing protein n=1 Tax=Oceanobacillus luteolus TaxID=1274358 RepID=A0ABW4HVV7_9BACI